jgi:polyhydroxyalkanoate synthesis regulator phasin
VADLRATKDEARRVVADLIAEAGQQKDNTLGRRHAQNLYNAAATIELLYRIGNFAR